MASDVRIPRRGSDAVVGACETAVDPPAALMRDLRIKHFDSTLVRPRSLDLEFRAGEVTVVSGRSGCGKSSLGLALCGLMPQRVEADVEGELVVLGRDPRRAEIALLCRDVGVVFQNPDAQLVTNSVFDEVCFGLENLELPVASIIERATDALRRVGLAEHHADVPSTLSGGQRQRLVLACAVATDPDLLVLDEPTAHVDAAGTAELLALLPELRRTGRSIVIIDHELDTVLGYADRLVVLDHQGRVLVDADPREIVYEHREVMEQAGVRPPIAVQVVDRLRAGGVDVRTRAVTPTELSDDLRGVNASAVRPVDRERRTATAPHVEARGLCVRRGRHPVLSEVNLTIERGELAAVVGANGAGKTTLTLALAGLIPSTGHVRVDGADPRRLGARELSDRIGYVFQNPEHQFVTDSVAREIAHGLRRRGVTGDVLTTAVEDLITRLDLRAVRDQHPFTLSEGQKRRLSVAATLVTHPGLLFLDEPTYGLDGTSATNLLELLTDLAAAGTTIVVVAHDLDLVAGWADSVVVAAESGILAHRPPGDVFVDRDLMARAGLVATPVRQCLESLAAEDACFANVHRLDQLPLLATAGRGAS